MRNIKGPVYELGVYVKDTNKENGPGHVSSFVRKTENGKSKTTHTSFFPGALGSLINGLTLGSIPVKGMLAQNHENDHEEAEHVLVKQISREEYLLAKAAHQEFKEEVETGHRTYAVFGSLNPVASFATTLMSASINAHLTAKQHKEHHSFHAHEAFCGIHVYDNEAHVNIKSIDVDNCTTSVTHILTKTGIGFENPRVPTFFTSELQKHGFKKVSKEELEVSRVLNQS